MSFDDLFRNPARFMTYSGEAVLKSRPVVDGEPDSVCFFLEPDPDGHPFARFKAGAFETSARFFMVCFEIDETGEPIDQDMRLRLTRALSSGVRQANRSKWVQAAGALCRTPRFHQFVKHKISKWDKDQKEAFKAELPPKISASGLLTLDGPLAEDFAAFFVRYHCGIRSRAELGFNHEGTERFNRLREDYWAFVFDSEENKHG